MFTVTESTGGKVEIKGEDVLRFRHTIRDDLFDPVEGKLSPEKTMIVWRRRLLVMELPEEIEAAMRQEIGTKLGRLDVRNGKHTWFNGPKSQGPVFVRSQDLVGGFKSAFNIGDKMTILVINSPQVVAQVVEDAGGTRLPLPGSSTIRDLIAATTSWLSPPTIVE